VLSFSGCNGSANKACLRVNLTGLVRFAQHWHSPIWQMTFWIQRECHIVRSTTNHSQRMARPRRTLTPEAAADPAFFSIAFPIQQTPVRHLNRQHPAIIISSIPDDDETSGRKRG